MADCRLLVGCDIDEDIASLFPLNLSGCLVALRACIDHSTKLSGVFSIAGVTFGYDRAVKAHRKWERILDGRTFHMTDLNAREGDFKGISDSEKHQIMVGTIDIIRQYASHVVAVSCDAELVADHLPTIARGNQDNQQMLAAFRSPYGYMCHLTMTALGGKANRSGRQSRRQISYIFERGDEGQKGLMRYLEFLQEGPEDRGIFLDSYSLASETVTPKDKMEGIFHAADLVAWEWGKHVERQRKNLPERKSMAALFGGNTALVESKHGQTLSNAEKCYFRHFRPEKLQHTLRFFRSALVAQSRDEVWAEFRAWEESL